jgi:hypothetical protein
VKSSLDKFMTRTINHLGKKMALIGMNLWVDVLIVTRKWKMMDTVLNVAM